MEMEVKKDDGAVIIKPLIKRIDSSTNLNFKNQVMDLLNQGNKYFLLNLSEVNFIDSSGLGTIIAIHKSLLNHQGTLVLCEVQPQVLNLFTITRMNSVFKIFKTEKEALVPFQTGKK